MHGPLAELIAAWGLTPAQRRALDEAVKRQIAEARTESSRDPEADTFDPDATLAPRRTGGRPSAAQRPGTAGSYEDLGPLGHGAMGEVRRVRERGLNRTLAMKIMRPEAATDPRAVARFMAEAQCLAQLQHPGIVPIHDLGRRPDGRPWFTMKEVRGRTLGGVLEDIHDSTSSATSQDWPLKRLARTLQRVCETVAFAHERGVVHRDLKPDNIMVGAFGEVLVLDWGLARVLDGSAQDDEHEPVVTDRSQDGGLRTLQDVVAGTPAYMAPEQAEGRFRSVGRPADIYALGAILYTILTGEPPYRGADAEEVLDLVRSGPPTPLRVGAQREPEALGRDHPGALVDICERAMARDPTERFATAAELATALGAWLDGVRATERATAVVNEAMLRAPEVERLRQEAAERARAAAAELAPLAPWMPEDAKAHGWALQLEAQQLEREAQRRDRAIEQGLHSALRMDAMLPAAHASLCQRLLERHREAEARRDADAAEDAAALLDAHAQALPRGHEARLTCARYLRGDGALTLETDPPGAEVLLHRHVTHNRRLIAVFDRSLGHTPLSAVPLSMGSYLCLLRAPGRMDVRYPVFIQRQQHWDGTRPGDVRPTPILMPRRGALSDDEVYVPPGWFWSGGDPSVPDGLPRRRLWVDALVVRRFPITNAEYIAFLDDLVASGREDEAVRYAPRERAGKAGELGAMIYGRGEGGRFVLQPDADGDVWEPRVPVLMVDAWGVAAWCRWLARKTGRPWRIPGEMEWEKAARGVDGRYFPWGDHVDPSWSCYRASHRGRRAPASVDSFPVDSSVYGVRGLAGNARDWTADPWDPEGPRDDVVPEPASLSSGSSTAAGSGDPSLVMRGGGWSVVARQVRLSSRVPSKPASRVAIHGGRAVFRLTDAHLSSRRPART